jgi:hypothetical protein
LIGTICSWYWVTPGGLLQDRTGANDVTVAPSSGLVSVGAMEIARDVSAAEGLGDDPTTITENTSPTTPRTASRLITGIPSFHHRLRAVTWSGALTWADSQDKPSPSLWSRGSDN